VAFDASTTTTNSKGQTGVEMGVVNIGNAVATEPLSYYLREFSAISDTTPRSIYSVTFVATYGDEETLWTVNAEVEYLDPNDTLTTTINVKGYYRL
jgi:hypothetical protein